MTAPEPVEITEHLLDVIGTEGSRAWPAEARANMLDDVRDRLLTIKQFADDALAAVDAESKFTEDAA